MKQLKLKIIFTALFLVHGIISSENKMLNAQSKRLSKSYSIDTVSIIHEIKILQKAIRNRDKAELKQFFAFPVQLDKNDAFYLRGLFLDPQNESPEFTEDDYDKECERLFFENDFVELFSRQQIESLGKDFSTDSLIMNKGNGYRMTLTCEDSIFMVYCNSTFSNFEIQRLITTTYCYIFSIVEGKKIRFKGYSMGAIGQTIIGNSE